MKKYISLFGGAVMLILFGYTIRTTLNNLTFWNIIISLGFLIFGYFGVNKYFKLSGKNQKKSKEEFTPIN